MASKAQTKGSKLSPDVKPFVPKQICYKSTLEPPEADVLPPYLTTCNPYVQGLCAEEQIYTENINCNRSQQNLSALSLAATSAAEYSPPCSAKPAINKRAHASFQNRDGYTRNCSNTRQNKNTEGPCDSSGEFSASVQSSKARNPKFESGIRGQESNKNPADVSLREVNPQKAGVITSDRSRKPKTHPKEADSFEVTLADFPELETSAICSPVQSVQHNPKSTWASALPSSTNHSQIVRPDTLLPHSNKNKLPRREETALPPQNSTNENVDSSTHSISLQAAQSSESSLPSSRPASSWANIASLPPKKPAPKELPRSVTDPKQKPGAIQKPGEGDMEEPTEKKKKKKRKKPKLPGNAPVPEETTAVVQELPKFEDEDEFPDLAGASGNTNKAHRSANQSIFCSSVAKKQHEIPDNTGCVGTSVHSTAERVVSSKDQKTAKIPTSQAICNTTETKIVQKAVKTSGKKSNNPVQFDLGDMLQVLERKQQAQKSKQDAKPVVLSVGGALPMVPKNPLVQKKHPRQLEKVAHNPLDSTSPLVKKGKQREVPKAKKPSPLKKIILKEREERKQCRLLEEQGLNPATELAVSNVQNEEQFEEELEGHESLNTTDFTDGQSTPDVPDQLEEEQKKTDELTPVENQAGSKRPKIHSRRFREYCSQVLSKEIDNSVIDLLKELVRFQDRLYLKDPLKAKMKRRLVMGLREVLKHLKLKKLKCVIISPNCERVQSKGGLDEALHTIIDTCREQNVPFVFALARKTLGRCVNKAVPVSVVGIFSYDGAQDHFHKTIELSSEARNAYEAMVASLEKGEGYDDQDEFPQNLPALQDTAQPTSESDEPEYIKTWKKMLENECNFQFLNFEDTTTGTLNCSLKLHSDDNVES
ncbi:selenocysteine insertion sequence-binding protein 2-like isoform X2 [Polyodon spathula]|uniref:selenocysteine insertion sequence-binding protein 2-like isoform X2 n=1 Tax=Polyodon spathula TaxID=7913 RepID=UPI001B7DE165|nr:selenocysteine insertion sequence-binding protein 2-like isoform X2 [Polyodon spathula]